MRLPRPFLAVLVLLAGLVSGFQCVPVNPADPPVPAISWPFPDQLSLIGDVAIRVVQPGPPAAATLVVKVDGADVTGLLSSTGPGVFEGSVPVPSVGLHDVEAILLLNGGGQTSVMRSFETADIDRPDDCEVLNNTNCMYPFPSAYFLTPDASKPNGVQMALPVGGLPQPNGPPISPDQFLVLDGTSPTPTIQIHFPGGVDLIGSNAPRLLPPVISVPTSPPYVGIRMPSARSLDPDSPTVILNATTGERVLHFAELDARASGNPARQALILRPSQSLRPGDRYIVAIRGLLHPGGAPIEAEPAFAALRDNRFTDIDGVSKRRPHFEDEIFPVLLAEGIDRSSLIVAWDFLVQSDEGLTHHALSMRDQSFDYVAANNGPGEQSFVVTDVEVKVCPGDDIGNWKIVKGTYEVPLFLTADPEVDITATGFLNVDADDEPVALGVTNPPFTVSIPCRSRDAGDLVHPVMIGHGLFGNGEGMIAGVAESPLGIDMIAAATNWRGLSGDDQIWIGLEIIGVGTHQFDNFPAFPDRLKQGQINTLVLARMLKDGIFNVDPAFQRDDTSGVLPGTDTEMFYYGISLGGIMGTMFAALTPDVERLNVDVPAMNFAMLLQRSSQFVNFELLLNSIGLTDPMDTLITLSLNHELWVRSEPAGYVTHITSDPLPGTNTKRMLVTMAFLDKQVSNQATEILARSLEIPNLDQSIQQGFPGIPDQAGPLDSALVVWDTGRFDIYDVAQYGLGPQGRPIIPPLANIIPDGVCDPHSARLTIPASGEQLALFLRPGGRVEGTCNGVCDGAEAFERPLAFCDPVP